MSETAAWTLFLLTVALTWGAALFLRPRWAVPGAPEGAPGRVVEWAGLTALFWVANVLLGTGLALACRALGMVVSTYTMGDVVVVVIAAVQAVVVMGEG